jgi:hypothetical protein
MSLEPSPDTRAKTPEADAYIHAEAVDGASGLSRGRPSQRFRDFSKAYRKAREWHCSQSISLIVATRFALLGDSGRFQSHGGWRVSRIYRAG